MLGSVPTNNNPKKNLEAAMVSTPEGFTENSTRSPITPTPVNKQNTKKSLCPFTNILDTKKKNSIYRVGYDK